MCDAGLRAAREEAGGIPARSRHCDRGAHPSIHGHGRDSGWKAEGKR